ncbi:MAG TPA: hypothetical protein VI795_01520 [Patescibacteria group bacterium]|nr:hypothetical protein [Patescibacteria group bacterium]
MENLSFSWGKLTIVAVTKKFSVGIDVIFPQKETDKEGAYLKKGHGIYYVLKGRGLCGDQPIKSGNVLKIKEGQKINIKNNSTKNLTVVTIYTPPYDDNNIGYK